MTFTAAVNLIANGILTAGMAGFYILLFRTDSVVNRWPLVGHWTLKVALVASGSGSLLNCLVLSDPPISEIVLNIGMAGIFAWAVYFHSNLLKNGSNRKPSKRNHRRDA